MNYKPNDITPIINSLLAERDKLEMVLRDGEPNKVDRSVIERHFYQTLKLLDEYDINTEVYWIWWKNYAERREDKYKSGIER